MIAIGAKGIGKTSLLRYFQMLTEKNGGIGVLFRAHKYDDQQRLVDELENILIEKISLGTLPKKYLEEIREIKNKDMEKIFEEIYQELKQFSPIVFFIDDANKLSRKALKSLIDLFTKLANKKIKYMLVLSSTGEIHDAKDFLRPVYVSEINEKDIKNLIEKALNPSKLKIGEECLHAIIEDSQGHPLVLLTICWTIYDKIKENEKIISKGHYIAYLPTIMNNLSRELFDELYEQNSESEKDILKAFANTGGEANVSYIATLINKPLNNVTTLVLRLSESGNIKKVARGKYKLFNRLYGKYILGK